MFCPYCHYKQTRVVDKRDSDDGNVVRRRRFCTRCKKRFTAYERVEEIDLTVIKKNESREPFDREKILLGIKKATEKRPVLGEQIEDLVDDIEMRLLNRKSVEVSSSDIGRMVLTRLRKIDKVAYIRFASVFLDFADVGHFQKAIAEIT